MRKSKSAEECNCDVECGVKSIASGVGAAVKTTVDNAETIANDTVNKGSLSAVAGAATRAAGSALGEVKDTAAFDDCSAECTKKCNARCDTAFKAGKNCLPWSHKGTEYDPSETLEVPVEDRGKERPKIKYPTLTQINTWFSFAKDVPLSDIVKEENVPHNFCRDPNKSGRIWCYVEDGDGGFVGAKCEPKSSTLHTHASDMYRIPYEVAEEMMDLRKNLREAENSVQRNVHGPQKPSLRRRG